MFFAKSYLKLNRTYQLNDCHLLHYTHLIDEILILLVIQPYHLCLSHQRNDEDIANLSAASSIEN